MHTTAPVRCPSCNRVLAILPGQWRVLRRLNGEERVREGNGGLMCHAERTCGARWEIAPVEAGTRKAA